jgi:hypothetical protein
MTAVENNVWMRFPAYLKKYIKCLLLVEHYNTGVCALDEKGFIKPVNEKMKRIRKEAAIASAKLLYEIENDYDVSRFQHLVPLTNKNRLYDMKTRPSVYLQRMVWTNLQFENPMLVLVNPSTRRLLSPIPLMSNMIPCHIRLETSGLAQLLMNKERIKAFVNEYELQYSQKLNINSKSDLLASYSKITGIQNPSEFEQATYATRFWKHICNFKNFGTILEQYRKNNKSTWVFDNAIVTDGVSVSFQITRKEDFRRKIKVAKIKDENEEVVKKSAKKEEFPNIDDAEFWEGKDEYKKLSNDPGKKDIACISDGVKTLCYTKGKRNHDTFANARLHASNKIRKKETIPGTYVFKNEDGENVNVENPTLHDFESQYMSEDSKKSCKSETFGNYWRKKKELIILMICRKAGKGKLQEPIMNNPYNKKYFRQAKFLVYCKTKSSEHKFFNKVTKTFGKPTIGKKIPKWMKPCPQIEILDKIKMNALKKTKNLIIGWGNWGATTNLKNNAPSPGIGFKRRASKFFNIATTPEPFTSQTCPCCQTRTLEHPEVGNDHIEKHHLLRCTNEKCQSRFWNRNVVGSFNILLNVFEAYKHCHRLNSLKSGENP